MRRSTIAAASLLLAACGSDAPAPRRLLLAATHTIEDSGLLQPLVDAFAAAHPEIVLQVSVSGTGQALAIARQGDADVVLTHSPDDERTFIEEGYGLVRREVMESDFVLLGPPDDPAGVAGERDIGEAFRRVAAAGATFISRGDQSGTHRKEQSVWQDIDIVPSGPAYIEAGVGMADALRIADQRRGYILADRPTFTMLQESLDLAIVSEGDDRLLNPDAVIIVRDAANPEGAQTFVDWITGPDAQTLIRDYGVDAAGRVLFTPTAAAEVTSHGGSARALRDVRESFATLSGPV
jgi:tungstate transport system substrate-binding protein